MIDFVVTELPQQHYQTWLPLFTMNFSSALESNRTESLQELNARYANALMPLTVTFGFFILIGFAGNFLILLVFSCSREYRKTNFKIFVITLAIIDIVTCMTLIPAEMVKQRHYFDFCDAMSCKVKCFFNVFGASASCMALFVISIDRFRKVVQPMRKQLPPKIAIYILIAAAFIFPILLSIPSAIMCGIQHTNKTNIYGGQTEVCLCSVEDKYRTSIWRKTYKLVLIILLAGISSTYIVLYTFVFKEVIGQLRTIRKNSSLEVTFSSDIYDHHDVSDSSSRDSTRSMDARKSIHHYQNGSMSSKYIKKKRSLRQFSMKSLKSIKGNMPHIHRAHIPSKSIIWFTLTLVFIVTYLTNNILTHYGGEVLFMSPERFAMFSFFYRIYFFNHMVNPLVYAIFVKRFRDSCKTLIPTVKKRILEWRD